MRAPAPFRLIRTALPLGMVPGLVFVLGFVLLCSPVRAKAQNGPPTAAGPSACTDCFDFNARCRQAYDLLFALRLDEGLALLEAERRANPGNRMPWFLANYADFFICYIGEDADEFQRREGFKEQRLDELGEGQRSSPWYRYTEAEVQLQWALARLKHEQYLKAFREIRRAYKLLEENRQLHPDFKPTYKSLGLLHAIIGAIPDRYQWGVRIVGLDGDMAQGMAELDALLEWARAEGDYGFEQEALVYRALMALYLENDPEAAWGTVSAERLKLEGHLLNHFVAASVAMRTGRNDEAVAFLEAAPRGPAYADFAYLDFMLGLAKLRRLDPDADGALNRFLLTFPGRNYVKECHQKLAWHALVQQPEPQNRSAYGERIAQALTAGTEVIDDDKQAQAEAEAFAEQGTVPNRTLLRARLLFDGGYYKRALQELEGKSIDDFNSLNEKVEFTYRAGRIYHEANLPEKALPYYEATLGRGYDLPRYFAANAALHIGYIQEAAGQRAEAEASFRTAMRLKDHPYASSIQSKARAGLNRLKE